MAALTGVVAVWQGRRRGKEREKDRRLVEEQLALAREQAEMRPYIRVRDVRLVDPEDSQALEGSVEPQWVNKLRNIGKVSPLDAVTAFIQQGRLMDATLADKTIVVELVNEGKAEARLMTGWIYLDASCFEPTKPSGGPNVSREGGEYRVDLAASRSRAARPRRRALIRRYPYPV